MADGETPNLSMRQCTHARLNYFSSSKKELEAKGMLAKCDFVSVRLHGCLNEV